MGVSLAPATMEAAATLRGRFSAQNSLSAAQNAPQNDDSARFEEFKTGAGAPLFARLSGARASTQNVRDASHKVLAGLEALRLELKTRQTQLCGLREKLPQSTNGSQSIANFQEN